MFLSKVKLTTQRREGRRVPYGAIALDQGEQELETAPRED
jgi:hypothetical protein